MAEEAEVNSPLAIFLSTVDADFKDGEHYDVFFPEGSDEAWNVVVSTSENDRFTHWALIQMLQAKDWEVDFEWAVFMKTGRCGSSGLRHFSKKFTDGGSAFKTFATWFEDKTGNKWLGDFTTTKASFNPVSGKYLLLEQEQGKSLLEFKGEKEKQRPKLGISDVPVDVYFKDRDLYQVYVTPDGDLWTAIMSVKEGSKHSQYAVLQVLVAKPDQKVEFDFVVFMRHGKLGGSAQRYAKRYTVEVAALSTFQQWFKEKTSNEWYGSFKDTLEDFVPQHGKFNLLDRSMWSEVVEFEERRPVKLIDSHIKVDTYYRDRDHYRVYHTDNDELWAAVMSRKDENGYYKRFVVLQMLAKLPDATVDFDYVVLRRIGERGESGQWTAKKFTNELDALRTFKMWYQDETGNQWKNSFEESFKEFKPQTDKMVLLPAQDWEEGTREVPVAFEKGRGSFEGFLLDRRSRAFGSSSNIGGPQKVSIDILKRAMAADVGKSPEPAPFLKPPAVVDEARMAEAKTAEAKTAEAKTAEAKTAEAKIETKIAEGKHADAKNASAKKTDDSSVVKSKSSKDTVPPLKDISTAANKKEKSGKAKEDTVKEEVETKEQVDTNFVKKDEYNNVIFSARMLQKDASGKTKFYTMQLLGGTEGVDLPKDEQYCFFVHTGKLGSNGASNFRLLGSLETGKKSFAKKFNEKTKNTWLGNYEATSAAFSPAAGEFELVKSFQ